MQFSKWLTLLFSALCLVAVAGVIRAPHLYYMAALLLTLPAVSYLLGWFALSGLEFEREMPPIAWEGETANLRYSVRNRSRVARFFLSIQEPLPEWAHLLSEESPLFNVGADEDVTIDHAVCFQRRGVYAAGGFEVTAMDPLGVFAFSRHIPAEGELVVYPLAQSIRTSALTGTERNGWQEFTSRVLRGSSVDPDGVRPYVPGDNMRRIHWRQTARTGHLSVIEFEEALASDLVIALDVEAGTEAGEDGDTTLEYGIRAAASLAQEAIAQGASVRLLLPSDAGLASSEAHYAPSLDGRGQSHLLLILDALARVEANSLVPLKQQLVDQAWSMRGGTTLLAITANSDPALADAFAPYMSMGLKVGVVFVDPQTFPSPPRSRREQDSAHLLASLAALRIPTHVVRHQRNGKLDLEEFVNA